MWEHHRHWTWPQGRHQLQLALCWSHQVQAHHQLQTALVRLSAVSAPPQRVLPPLAVPAGFCAA